MAVQLPNYELCYVCGHANPLGLNVRFHADGNTVSTRFRPDPLHSGYPGRLHGGIIASLLDETMGWAPCVVSGRFCVSVELNIRYVKPVPPAVELLVVGRAVSTSGRIWEAEGEVRDESGTVYARGKGRYFPLSEAETQRVMEQLTLNGERVTLAEVVAQAVGESGDGQIHQEPDANSE